MFLQDDYNFSVDENLELHRIEWLLFPTYAKDFMVFIRIF
ncbi:Uncharacterised protein [uncultured Bacteroides sp.]|nr:Uncharacterised protein [uncultured Bacteroides sp.]